ncbi:MAG: class I SAM-dependent methyltransferase [Chitinivibrionales bacterium]
MKTAGRSVVKVRAGNRDFFICKPADPTEILNRITEDEFREDEFLPYWAEYWPSSVVLARYLLKEVPPSTGNLCEIGCGLGTLSVILKYFGYWIIPMDYSPDSCSITKENGSRNRVDLSPVCTDWRSPGFKTELRTGFNTITGSDILYEKRFTEPVLEFIKTYLAKNGTAFIADPERGFHKDFAKEAEAHGFDITRVLRTKEPDTTKYISVFRLTES